MGLKKGDKVIVRAGKDRGKAGKVLQIDTDSGRLTVEGLNLRFKNMRAQRQGEKGQRIQFPAAMDISNVSLICPKCGKPTRIGSKLLENKKRVRVCVKCKEALS